MPRLLLLSILAMLAFAANSLLCRMALRQASIDPASFTSLRVLSGTLMLAVVVRWRSGAASTSRSLAASDWWAAGALWAYMVCFSFAYGSLSAGAGALILFGAVQLTMFSAGWRAGERFSKAGWFGLAMAMAGLLYLVSPGLAAPPLPGAALMASAGMAWGLYSLRGRRAADPLAASAGNFLRALPLAVLVSIAAWPHRHVEGQGIALAFASGALTSGLGYVIWYAALPHLTAMRAATLQLSVPPLAAFGGVWWLEEALTRRLVLASVVVLGGILLVLLSRARQRT